VGTKKERRAEGGGRTGQGAGRGCTGQWQTPNGAIPEQELPAAAGRSTHGEPLVPAVVSVSHERELAFPLRPATCVLACSRAPSAMPRGVVVATALRRANVLPTQNAAPTALRQRRPLRRCWCRLRVHRGLHGHGPLHVCRHRRHAARAAGIQPESLCPSALMRWPF
jgi:hypothetical protein